MLTWSQMKMMCAPLMMNSGNAPSRSYASLQTRQTSRPHSTFCSPDLDLAENYLQMAACVHPEHPEALDALAVVRDAKSITNRRRIATESEE